MVNGAIVDCGDDFFQNMPGSVIGINVCLFEFVHVEAAIAIFINCKLMYSIAKTLEPGRCGIARNLAPSSWKRSWKRG